MYIGTGIFWLENNVPIILNFVSQTLLHGSPEAKKAGEAEILQHSRKVARGKYVHAFEGKFHNYISCGLNLIFVSVHRVRPDAADLYKKAA